MNKDVEADNHPSQPSNKDDESASVENRRRGKARQTETLEQIIGTIIEEHKVMKPGQILQYIEKYLPEGWEKPNDDKVRRAFNTYKKNISNRIFFTSIANDLYKGHMFSEETLNKSRQKKKRNATGHRVAKRELIDSEGRLLQISRYLVKSGSFFG